MRLMLVEDDERLAELLGKALKNTGFEIDAVSTEEDAAAALNACRYALIVLDRRLPDIEGLDIVRTLRRRGDTTPVLMLTAQGRIQERVAGLKAGADDCLAKPFHFEELVARLRALLRRSGQFSSRMLAAGNLRLDAEAGLLEIDGHALTTLSVREVAILTILMRCAGKVVTKKLLADRLVEVSGDISANAIEVYVHRARKHLAEAGATIRIDTVRDVGYIVSALGRDVVSCCS